MFILTKFADLVQIAPQDFSKRSVEAIQDNINEKFANKVVQKIGLCICLYDILWTSEGLIGHGTGLVNVNVEFRLIVFRPFRGETLLGMISSQTPEGMNLKVGDFFQDVFIPWEELPQPAEFNHGAQMWMWNIDDSQLFYDHNELVRFQVTDEQWHDQTPTGPNQSEDLIKIPYQIRGSMAKEGMGVCLWWDFADAEEEEEAAE